MFEKAQRNEAGQAARRPEPRAEVAPELRVQRAADGGGTAPLPAEAAAPARSLLVDEGAGPIEPFQLRKSAFLAELQAGLESALSNALAGTGFTAESCPTIAYWMAHYAGRSAADVERALRQYTGAGQPASARDYLPVAVERVLAGVMRWRSSNPAGIPTTADVPPGAAPEGAGPEGTAVQATRDGPGPARAADPAAVRSALGAGRPLPGDVRRTMEKGLGADFSEVRIHTDARAGGLARDLSAHAFTVGQNVAFAPGRFAPGTLPGDLMIAHELAHTLQQRGGRVQAAATARDEDGFERAADRAAVRAVIAARDEEGQPLPYDTAGLLAEVGTEAPRSDGLRLQRCKSCSSEEAPKWWEELPSSQQGRGLYFRPVSDVNRLRELLAQVDVVVATTGAKTLQAPPNQTRKLEYVVGTLSYTQWTPPDVKTKIEAIFPPAGDTIVTDEKIRAAREVVAEHRKAHPGSFSRTQAAGLTHCSTQGACIGTLNRGVETLYGSGTVTSRQLGGDVNKSMDALEKKGLVSEERKFPATYTGTASPMELTREGADSGTEVALSGIGTWVLGKANAGSDGVHVFLFAAANGYHSITLLVLKEGAAASTIVWRDQHGAGPRSAEELDAQARRLCWGNWAGWVVKQHNRTFTPTITDASDLTDPEKRKKILTQIEASAKNDMLNNRVVHLQPPA